MCEIVVDNFAGGGGASTGIEMAIGRSVDIAISHDPAALVRAICRSYAEMNRRSRMQCEWISVKERLPEPLVYVLVYIPCDTPYTIREGFMTPTGMWNASHYDRGHGEITHWMPFPVPPNEEER